MTGEAYKAVSTPLWAISCCPGASDERVLIVRKIAAAVWFRILTRVPTIKAKPSRGWARSYGPRERQPGYHYVSQVKHSSLEINTERSTNADNTGESAIANWPRRYCVGVSTAADVVPCHTDPVRHPDSLVSGDTAPNMTFFGCTLARLRSRNEDGAGRDG